jgi:hypothetical protein
LSSLVDLKHAIALTTHLCMPDLVVLHGGRVFQEAALVSLAQQQPASPGGAGAGAAGAGAGGAAGGGAQSRASASAGAAPGGAGEWGKASASKPSVAVREGSLGKGGGGAGGESGGAGGDGAAAVRLLLQRGFVVEGKHFYRQGLLHGRDW